MIDIHSHVLPMVDDGASSWSETETLFSQMSGLGYTRIVATPHWAVGMPSIADRVVERARVLAANFHIDLSIARECRIHPRLLDHVRKIHQCRVDGGTVVLVELPWGNVPQYTVNVFMGLLRDGYRPVLAHAERHPELWEPNSPLDSLIGLGLPIQVNLSTIGGQHGRSAQRRAFSLLEQGKVALVASDIHSVDDVNEAIAEPLHLLKELVGDAALRTLTLHNPQALLESRSLVDLSDGSSGHSFDESVLKRVTRGDGIWSKLVNALPSSRS